MIESRDIERAKNRIKTDGKLIGYLEGTDLYLIMGSVARFNGDCGLKLFSETTEGLEKLAKTLKLPF